MGLRTYSLLTAVTTTLVIAACDGPSRPTAPPMVPSLSQQSPNAPAACDDAASDLAGLYATNGPRGAELRNKLREGVVFFYDKNKPTQGLAKLSDIVAVLQGDVANGRLTNPTAVAQAFADLAECFGADLPDDFADNPDPLVGVISDPTKAYDFFSLNNDYGAKIPKNFFSAPVILLGDRQPDDEYFSDEDEYLIKTQIKASPPGLETHIPGNKAAVKICVYDPSNHEHLDETDLNDFAIRILQVHEDESGDEELPLVLPPSPVFGGSLPFCTGQAPDASVFNSEFITLGPRGFADRMFAAAVRTLQGTGRLVTRALTPREAFAAKMMFFDGGVGGLLEDFSSFFIPIRTENDDLRIKTGPITTRPGVARPTTGPRRPVVKRQ